MDVWLSGWLEWAELVMVCVYGWLAGWLDDRLSVRLVDIADEISRHPWPPLWLFRQFDQISIRPNSKFDQIFI